MLTLPPKFKQALGNGTRTSLYPLVRIYKGYQIDDTIPDNAEAINLSIKETTIKNFNDTYESYIPLLLNSPSISSKADIINNKYTISSVSLSISNAPYNGKIFSDDIPSLLNAVVQVYYAANGLDSLDDCLLVYTGTIRRYSQSAETLNLTLEDLTQQKLETKIPATLIEDDGNHKTEDIGKPYPMVYGYVDKSPSIYNNKEYIELDKPNRQIYGDWNGANLMNFGNDAIAEGHPLVDNGYLKRLSFLSVYDNDYLPITQTVGEKWGSREYPNLVNTEVYTINEATENSPANIVLNSESFIYEGYEIVDGTTQEVGVGLQGIPARIYRPITNVSFYSINAIDGDYQSNNQFIGYQNDDGSMQSLPETSYEYNLQDGSGTGSNNNSAAKKLYDDFWNDGPTEGDVLKFWQPTKINDAFNTANIEKITDDVVDENWLEFYNQNRQASKFPVSWIQNNIETTGLHISAKNRGSFQTGSFARLSLNDNVGSYPCITKVFYDISYFTNGNFTETNLPSAVKFWVERQLATNYSLYAVMLYRTMESIEEFNTFYKQMFFWEQGSTTENFATFGLVPNFNHDFVLEETAATDNNVDASIFPHYGRIDNDGGVLNYIGYWNQLTGFNTTDACDSIQWGAPIYSTDTNHNVIANLKEIYVIQDVLVTEYHTKDFYADIAGRTNNDELITNVNSILKDILQDELLYNGSIDETNADIQNDWIYAFTMKEQKEAKSLFEGMFKSSLLIPSFDSAGQFKFIGIKQIISSYDDIVLINTEDVVKYSFELTKIDDIYNSVNVRYKKNYGSGEYDKQTGYTIADTSYNTLDEYTTFELGYSSNNAYDIGYYGLDSEDAKLEVETEYIRDKYTAQRLQKRLLLWYANQHIITKIDLPPSYMNLEAGDYIKFSELLGNKLAFGYDYTTPEQRNGQLIYDVFFVTKVSKSLSKVSIEAVQVHRGEYGYPSIAEEDTGDIINGNGEDVTENNQIPDPSDDPNYTEDSISVDEFEEVEDDYLRIQMGSNTNLNTNQVVAFVSTNMDESWEYNIWVRAITSEFEYNGVQYNAGEYEVGDLSGMDLVNHALTMQDSNGYITIERKFEIFPQGAVIEFVLEVKNTQFTLEELFDQLGINEENITIGDLNNDLNVNILDIVRLVQIILGHGDEPNNLEEIAGNANQDSVLNVQDVIILINQILGQ